MRRHVLRVTAISLAAAVLALVQTSWAQRRETCDNQKSRALVLSGGGFRGAFEAGAVYHLVVHRGCDFQDFAGVSTGALNAAYLAQAPSNPHSLAGLVQQTVMLRDAWKKEIDDLGKVYKPRFWGLISGLVLGVFIFDKESAYLPDPLRALIRAVIDTERLRTSGREVRVGVVSFWDGKYREIVLSKSPPIAARQFLEYVLASTAVPVITEMPRIREDEGQPKDDDDTWAQFGDGGVRHTTPIANYFRLRGIRALKIRMLEENREEIPRHDSPIEEVFVIVTHPYDPQTDEFARPRCCPNESDRHIRSGREITERTHHLAINAPYRWDLNFARVANEILQWREEVYQKAEELLSNDAFSKFTTELNATFPIESYNKRPGQNWSLPYRMLVISPKVPQEDPLDTPERPLSEIIAKQLRDGCLTANEILKEEFGDAEQRCKQDFPPPGK